MTIAIKLRQLEIFLALAEEKHFGRAASRVGMAQPALSQQIRVLEDTLGVPLFERTNRSVEISAAGLAILPVARRAVRAAVQTEIEASRFIRGEVGEMSISYSASIAYSGVLQSAIGEYRRKFPDVQLHIEEMSLAQQAEFLLEGRCDIGFIRPPTAHADALDVFPLLEERVILLLPAEHPLVRHQPVSLEQCAQERFIIPNQSPEISFHKLTLDLCAQAGFTPHTAHRARDWVTIASMVALGMGVALAPYSLSCISLPGLALCAIRNDAIRAPIGLALRKGARSPVVAGFLAHVLPRFDRSELAG